MKLLVCGDIVDTLSPLHAKVEKLNASANGPFDVLLCTNIPDAAILADYKDGKKAFPIALYFVTSNADTSAFADFEAGQVTSMRSKVTFLGAVGTTEIDGLVVSYCGGAPPAASVAETLSALQSMAPDRPKGAKSVVDVLLTTAWPRLVLNGNTGALPAVLQGVQSAHMAPGKGAGGIDVACQLAKAAEPRYHFAGGTGAAAIFFQRAPYANPGSGVVTRFVSLAPVAPAPAPGSDGKGEAKHLHALNLTPATAGIAVDVKALTDPPPGTTPSPYAPPPLAAAAPAAASASTSSASTGAAALPAVPFDGLAQPPSLKRARLPDGSAAGLSAERIAQLEAEGLAAAASGAQHFWNLRGRGGGGAGGGYGRGGGGGRGGRGGHGGYQSRPLPPGQARQRPECWFCLASPQVEKHLVVSIGNEAYLALPKGGINPSHVLVVPIAHVDALATAPEATRDEAARFVRGLDALAGATGHQIIVFERVLQGRRGDIPVHTHMQIIAVPDDTAAKAESLFLTEGAYRQVAFERIAHDTPLADLVALPASAGQGQADGEALTTCEYLYIEVPDPKMIISPSTSTEGASAAAEIGGRRPFVRLLHRVPQGFKHPVQFGREALCRLLNCPDRIQWKACAGTKEEETAQAADFRLKFQPHDFTLEL